MNSFRCVVVRAMLTVAVGTAIVAAQQPGEPTGARAIWETSGGNVLAPRSSDTRRVAPQPTRGSGVQSVGVHYWIDLEGQGPVTDAQTFVTGDRIRVNVRSNTDGFLAVWAFNASGKAALLLPVNGDGSGTPIKGRQPYVSPPIRFRPPAGNERLLLFFGRRKADLPSLEIVEDEAALAAFRGVGGRDLVVETEQNEPGAVGTYVVNRRGGPVACDIRLRHVAP